MMSPVRYFLCWIGFLALGCIAHAQDVVVEAFLDATEISLGESTRISIRINSNTEADISIPHIPDVTVRHAGVSRSTTIINGVVSTRNTHSYLLTPEKPGTHTIPPFTVSIKRKEHKTQPLTLSVLPSSQKRDPELEGIAFIQIGMEKSTLYVGEKTRVRLNLFTLMTARIEQIRSIPEISNDAVMLNPLGNSPQQATTDIEGKRYQVFSWETTLTALKRGLTTLEASAEIDVLTPTQRRSQGFPQSLFDDDFFGTTYTRTPLRVFSNTIELDIRPIPPAPEGKVFSGAIGKFGFTVEASPTELTAGDPITLTLKVTGTGNFDRVFHDGLTASDGWKIYSPQSTFTPSEKMPLSGEKVFRQAIIPTDPRIPTIPSLSFTYFDPDKQDFVTIENKPIPIQVKAAPGQVIESPTENPASDPESGNNPPDPSTRLVDLAVSLDRAYSSYKPVTYSVWFWVLMLIPILVVPLATYVPPAIIGKLRGPDNRKKKTMLHLEKEMEKALQSKNKTAYLEAASAYSCQILAEKWKVSPLSITTADIKFRCGNRYPGILTLFTNREVLHYAGMPERDLDMNALHQGLQSEWQTLQSI